MKRIKYLLMPLLIVFAAVIFTGCSSTRGLHIAYRYADQNEAETLLLGQTEYLENLTQNDLDYRVGKKGATLDEFRELISANVRSYSDDEKAAIDKCMKNLETRLTEMGFKYELPKEIIFIKTTMDEEGGAGGYTHGTQICLGDYVTQLLIGDNKANQEEGYNILVHEFFHCMTRENYDFRRDMYSVIQTEIDSSITIKPEMRANILSNPDVERYDNYAVFEIEGKPVRCMIVTYIEDYQEGYGTFFDHVQPALLPVDTQDKFYMAADVPDFRNVVGRNTDYVIAAEECMADNFAFAVVYKDKDDYASPEIIEDINEKIREYEIAGE